MKEIKLTQGKVALVDDEDYEYLNQWKWFAYKSRNTFYAKRSGRFNGKNTNIIMHRVIMNTPVGMETDHRDHNGLNNQKYNMRICTIAQNNYNRIPYGWSKYLGVSHIEGHPIAQIRKERKLFYLGFFKTEEDAAHAYDKKAIEFFGEFANLNFPYEKQVLYGNI